MARVSPTEPFVVPPLTPWQTYLAEVYGASAGQQPIDVSRFSWLYWSAPAVDAKPTRVWVLSSEYKKRREELSERASHQALLDDMRPGDGTLHMYSDAGFFRWPPHDDDDDATASAGTAEWPDGSGRLWAEVLRSSGPEEDDESGFWFYALHGSGFWLDLGRTLDTTCGAAHAYAAHGGVEAPLHPDRDPSQTIVSLRCSTAAEPPLDEEQPDATTDVASAAHHHHHTSSPDKEKGARGAPVAAAAAPRRGSCQPSSCAAPSCDAARQQATREQQASAVDEEPECLRGLETMQPPMLHSPVTTKPRWLRHSFDTALKWSPSLLRWWARASPREVIDLRAYGAIRCDSADDGDKDGKSGTAAGTHSNATGAKAPDPRCKYAPKLSPCGGWFPRFNASTQHVRVGWRARGPECADCTNDQLLLNCGPHVSPAAAHAKARRAFNAPAPVRGVCLLFPANGTDRTADAPAAAYARVHRTATSASAFAREASRSCLHAWFSWPPDTT